jgi:hypothetical protein
MRIREFAVPKKISDTMNSDWYVQSIDLASPPPPPTEQFSDEWSSHN